VSHRDPTDSALPIPDAANDLAAAVVARVGDLDHRTVRKIVADASEEEQRRRQGTLF
jgi:uncharacterized protein with PhoU and TrkA domain